MPRCMERNEQNARAYRVACRLVAMGFGLTEIAACRHAPALSTLSRWLADDDDFRFLFENAHGARMERLAESIVALADDKASSPRDRKLGIEARKWRIAHMAKKAAATDRGERRGVGTDDIVRRLREAHERIAREAAERASHATDVGSAREDHVDPERAVQERADERPKAIVPAARPEPAPALPDDRSAAPGDGSWSIRFFPPSEGVADVVAGNQPADDGW